MANRFWVGGTGTWDSSDTTHWASSSGGAGGQSVPGSSDTVTFDGSSGGGTVTLNFGGTISVISITMGAFTGTWDNSINNNNITLVSGNFNASGSATRTIKLGTATYTLPTSTTWNMGTTTGLTLLASSSTITFTGTSGNHTLIGGASQTYGTVNFPACDAGVTNIVTGAFTIGTLNVTAPFTTQFSATMTISNAVAWNGSSGNSQSLLLSSTYGSQRTINFAGGSTLQWMAFQDINLQGSPTITNSFNLGNNAGATINLPISSTTSGGVIGS